MSKYNFIDLTGQIFGKLRVLQREINIKYKRPMWRCKCECGKEIIARGSHLIEGNIKSCSCLRKEISSINGKKRKIHGYYNTKIYHVWQQMIQRCNNSNCKIYKYYGGRIPPITVCYRWSNKKNGFQNFLRDIGEIPEGLTLDRINNDGNYEPNNWRLATRKEQSRNMRNNISYFYNKKNQSLSALAEDHKINRRTLEKRLKTGLSIEEALNTPIAVKYRNKRSK